MPEHVIDLTIDAFAEAKKPIKNSTILILGISYKPNVKDIQLSPAEKIIKKLQDLGVIVKIYDPYFKSTNVFGIETAHELSSVVTNVDGVILVTAHNEFHDLEPVFLASKMKTRTLRSRMRAPPSNFTKS